MLIIIPSYLDSMVKVDREYIGYVCGYNLWQILDANVKSGDVFEVEGCCGVERLIVDDLKDIEPVDIEEAFIEYEYRRCAEPDDGDDAAEDAEIERDFEEWLRTQS